MKNILLIAKNITKQIFRSKNSFIIYIILPIIGILIPLFMFSTNNGNFIRVGIANQDEGFLSRALYEDISRQKRFKVSSLDESEINRAISSGKLECAVVIPEGYTNSFLSGKPMTLEIRSVQGIAATGWVEGYLKTALPNVSLMASAANGDMAVFRNLYYENLASATPVEIKGVKNVSAGLSVTYVGIGFLIQFMLIGTNKTASLIIKERKKKTLARICCAPVKGYEYISGNVLVNVSLVTLQTAATLLILKYILHIETGASPLSMMVVLFPLLIASVGATLMLVAFARNEHQLTLLSTLFIYPTCLVSGCFWEADMMPQYMQKISHLFPQRWALDALTGMMSGKGLVDVANEIMVVAAFAAAFFAIAVYGFSRKELASA